MVQVGELLADLCNKNINRAKGENTHQNKEYTSNLGHHICVPFQTELTMKPKWMDLHCCSFGTDHDHNIIMSYRSWYRIYRSTLYSWDVTRNIKCTVSCEIALKVLCNVIPPSDSNGGNKGFFFFFFLFLKRGNLLEIRRALERLRVN